MTVLMVLTIELWKLLPLSRVMFPTAALLGEYMVLPTVLGRALAVTQSVLIFLITPVVSWQEAVCRRLHRMLVLFKVLTHTLAKVGV